MKVKELIELLSKLDQEKEIKVADNYYQENNELIEGDIWDWGEYYLIG